MLGYKSPFVTFLLSFLPGAGHLYLGLNKRGLQFMAAFFGTIFLISEYSHGALLPFVLVILWFYCMFDALQLVNRINYYVRQGRLEELERPFDPADLTSENAIDPLWLGGAALLVGVTLLFRSALYPVWQWLRHYRFDSALVGLALIAFGVFLVLKHVRESGSSGAGAAPPREQATTGTSAAPASTAAADTTAPEQGER